MQASTQLVPRRPARLESSTWQHDFEELLPRIQRCLVFSFRDLDPEAKDEMVQEGVVNCVAAYARLHNVGRAAVATASSLASFAARQVRCGRTTATKLNVKDVMSPYAQRRKGLSVESLDRRCPNTGDWIEALAEDRRASVPDRVVFRVDVPKWLTTLTLPKRRIAKDLATGATTAEIAKKYRVTSGRISQIRRELFDSWHRFHGETTAHRAA